MLWRLNRQILQAVLVSTMTSILPEHSIAGVTVIDGYSLYLSRRWKKNPNTNSDLTEWNLNWSNYTLEMQWYLSTAVSSQESVHSSHQIAEARSTACYEVTRCIGFTILGMDRCSFHKPLQLKTSLPGTDIQHPSVPPVERIMSAFFSLSQSISARLCSNWSWKS